MEAHTFHLGETVSKCVKLWGCSSCLVCDLTHSTRWTRNMPTALSHPPAVEWYTMRCGYDCKRLSVKFSRHDCCNSRSKSFSRPFAKQLPAGCIAMAKHSLNDYVRTTAGPISRARSLNLVRSSAGITAGCVEVTLMELMLNDWTQLYDNVGVRSEQHLWPAVALRRTSIWTKNHTRTRDQNRRASCHTSACAANPT